MAVIAQIRRWDLSSNPRWQKQLLVWRRGGRWGGRAQSSGVLDFFFSPSPSPPPPASGLQTATGTLAGYASGHHRAIRMLRRVAIIENRRSGHKEFWRSPSFARWKPCHLLGLLPAHDQGVGDPETKFM